MVGVEILKAKGFLLDMIQESFQASFLHLMAPKFPDDEGSE
jgi:hypothetical protein